MRPLHAALLTSLFLLPFTAVLRADPDPAAVVLTEEQRDAFREKVTYKPAAFEMDVGPAIHAGEDLLVETVAFPSPVKSVDHAHNDTVRGKLFRKERPEKAAVIVLGGWRHDPMTPALGAQLAGGGVQVLYLQLPFQEQRTPAGRRPGEVTFSADLDQNEATFVQLAQDVGRARDWLVRERGIDAKRVGLLGTSLGGFAVASLYGLSHDYACAGVMLAGSNIDAVVFNGSFLTAQLATELEEKGIDRDDFRKRMALVDPGTWVDAKRRDGLFLLAAEKDSVVPLDTVKALAKLYGGAHLEIMPGVDHIAPDALRKSFPLVEAHLLKRLGVAAEATADDKEKSPAPAGGGGSKPAPADATK